MMHQAVQAVVRRRFHLLLVVLHRLLKVLRLLRQVHLPAVRPQVRLRVARHLNRLVPVLLLVVLPQAVLHSQVPQVVLVAQVLNRVVRLVQVAQVLRVRRAVLALHQAQARYRRLRVVHPHRVLFHPRAVALLHQALYQVAVRVVRRPQVRVYLPHRVVPLLVVVHKVSRVIGLV